ncbi:hypothetical protein EYR41_009964 [Orbilia oligospora]|uniref:Uncharacterized protein n=1 Tax=Orbilia oligospora TaxID=2813651 RepID=A0A7C8KGC4_ORBOL|nr:hypothetical protein TWF751_005486 [Orbilia oligospora]TGJ63874.1 hypothetical protein EYR41_009964 [Orbilia oligospora]
MGNISQSPILNLPNEIHIEIFKRCTSFKDAVTLVVTCQQLHRIWENHQKAVISHIGGRCIVAFDDALRAVRAIDMAERQHQVLALQSSGANVADAEKPPKRIPIHRLGSSSNPPSPDEITQVFDLKYFVEAALFLGHQENGVHIFCQQSSSKLRLPGLCPHGVDGSHAGVSAKEVDFKIYASMYRFFLVSAVLSSVYLEPFFTDRPTSTTLRTVFSTIPAYPRFGAEEVSYLRQWACYNKQHASQAQLDGTFGELGDYLIERGRKDAGWNETVISDARQPNNDRDAQTANAVQTFMMIIGCHELFWRVAQQELYSAGRAFDREPVWFDGLEYRHCPVTFLGIHGALDAWIPKNAADILRHPSIQFVSRPVGSGADGNPLGQIRLLKLFHYFSSLDDMYGSPESDLPYELGFFEYVLKRNFGLKLRFKWGYGETVYNSYLLHGTAFRGAEQFRRDVPKILLSCVL